MMSVYPPILQCFTADRDRNSSLRRKRICMTNITDGYGSRPHRKLHRTPLAHASVHSCLALSRQMAVIVLRVPHRLLLAGFKSKLGEALGEKREVGVHRRRMGEVEFSNLRSALLHVLLSRRRPHPEVAVESGKPVMNPMYQGNTLLDSREVMESCPKEHGNGFQDELIEENLYLITEGGEQGRLPLLILSSKQNGQRRPAIVILHSSYKCKEWLRPLLEAYASRGYVAVAIDSRYHGERASNKTTYQEALISSWKNGDTMPFVFDTVWDLIKLADYLVQREDIDPCRIGITGESLGGMHAWFAAVADTRFAVVAPIIGFQGFGWAMDNDKWQARVNSIKPVFEEARIDLGKDQIDKEVVEKVWERIAPGLASQFDSPNSILAIAPRPLLIIQGGEDPRCPLAGLDVPISRAQEAYKEAGCPENFQFIAEAGIGHRMTTSMVKAASDWFDKFLKP